MFIALLIYWSSTFMNRNSLHAYLPHMYSILVSRQFRSPFSFSRIAYVYFFVCTFIFLRLLLTSFLCYLFRCPLKFWSNRWKSGWTWRCYEWLMMYDCVNFYRRLESTSPSSFPPVPGARYIRGGRQYYIRSINALSPLECLWPLSEFPSGIVTTN
jgi:hypothetical protein